MKHSDRLVYEAQAREWWSIPGNRNRLPPRDYGKVGPYLDNARRTSNVNIWPELQEIIRGTGLKDFLITDDNGRVSLKRNTRSDLKDPTRSHRGVRRVKKPGQFENWTPPGGAHLAGGVQPQSAPFRGFVYEKLAGGSQSQSAPFKRFVYENPAGSAQPESAQPESAENDLRAKAAGLEVYQYYAAKLSDLPDAQLESAENDLRAKAAGLEVYQYYAAKLSGWPDGLPAGLRVAFHPESIGRQGSDPVIVPLDLPTELTTTAPSPSALLIDPSLNLGDDTTVAAIQAAEVDAPTYAAAQAQYELLVNVIGAETAKEQTAARAVYQTYAATYGNMPQQPPAGLQVALDPTFLDHVQGQHAVIVTIEGAREQTTTAPGPQLSTPLADPVLTLNDPMVRAAFWDAGVDNMDNNTYQRIQTQQSAVLTAIEQSGAHLLGLPAAHNPAAAYAGVHPPGGPHQPTGSPENTATQSRTTQQVANTTMRRGGR